jgi:hypothetical protein
MNINRLETGQALRRLLAGLIEIVGAPRREFGLSETGSLETVSSSAESSANLIRAERPSTIVGSNDRSVVGCCGNGSPSPPLGAYNEELFSFH